MLLIYFTLIKKPYFCASNFDGMAKKKQQEETIVDVQEVYTKTEMFVDKNRKALTGVIVAIAVIVAGYFAYTRLYKLPKEKEAAENMWKAEEYFTNDSLDLALYGDDLYPGFEEIADEYGGTNAGKRAHFYIGVINRDRGEFEIALEHFEKASSLGDEAVSTMAIGNVGDMHIELGNLEEGVKHLQKAARNSANEFTRPLYLLKAARVYMELGQDDKALSNFKEITENYPDATEYKDAKKYQASMEG